MKTTIRMNAGELAIEISGGEEAAGVAFKALTSASLTGSSIDEVARVLDGAGLLDSVDVVAPGYGALDPDDYRSRRASAAHAD